MEHARGDLIASEAERIVDRALHTDFAHEPVIDPKTETYKVDGAAFAAFLLEQFNSQEVDRIPKAADSRYPSATEFHKFFITLPHHGWAQVGALADVRRGDVIAWGDSSDTPGRGHGHVAIVKSTPRYDEKTEVWIVHVLDSSSDAHFDDSRVRDAQYRPGVGSGALKFRVDGENVPVAVQVSHESRFHSRSIAIGRVEGSALAEQPRSESRSPNGAVAIGQRIERAAVANEVLRDGEFALTTYALASSVGMLLLPTTLACWGAGQTVPPSLGSGTVTYNFAGGVVFRNL